MNAVVLLSGGQDSGTCLFWAVDAYGAQEVAAVGIDYGQRHAVELHQARELARLADVPYTLLPLNTLAALGAASLTNPSIEHEMTAGPKSGNRVAAERGLPSSFVPGRNLLFLTIAAAFALQHGAHDVVTGVCEADEQGYPDCRASFLVQMERAIQLGTDSPYLKLVAPLIAKSKAETWLMAKRLGVIDVIRKHTRTCYNGIDDLEHDWGKGCGSCPACKVRADGYAEFRRLYT